MSSRADSESGASALGYVVAGGVVYLLAKRAAGGLEDALSSLWTGAKKAAGAAADVVMGGTPLRPKPTAGNSDAELAPEGPARAAQEARDRAFLMKNGWTVGPDGRLVPPGQPATTAGAAAARKVSK